MDLSFDEERKRFKVIARNITRHELNQTQTNWFGMERRAKLRRLGGLAVVGNQPALQVHVKATEVEKAKVARSIMQQKVGSNPKAMKSYDELQARKQHNKQQREQASRSVAQETTPSVSRT